MYLHLIPDVLFFSWYFKAACASVLCEEKIKDAPVRFLYSVGSREKGGSDRSPPGSGHFFLYQGCVLPQVLH